MFRFVDEGIKSSISKTFSSNDFKSIFLLVILANINLDELFENLFIFFTVFF